MKLDFSLQSRSDFMLSRAFRLLGLSCLWGCVASHSTEGRNTFEFDFPEPNPNYAVRSSVLVPFDTAPPPYTNFDLPQAPSFRFGDLERPLPTNEWWENLVLDPGDNPCNQHPYSLRAFDDGVDFGVPEKTVAVKLVAAPWIPGMKLQTVEQLESRRITEFSKLAVTLKYKTTAADGSMSLPIVRGSAYMTAQYHKSTPRVTTIRAIISVNGVGDPGSTTSDKFKLELNSGHIFIMYTSTTAEFSWDRNAIWLTGGQRDDFTVRVALLPRNDREAAESELDRGSKSIPIMADIDVEVDGDSSVTTFTYQTIGDPQNLLITAMAHHRNMLAGPQSTGLKVREF